MSIGSRDDYPSDHRAEPGSQRRSKHHMPATKYLSPAQNDHVVATSGQKHAISVDPEAVRIAFLRFAWVLYCPFSAGPPDRHPADNRKIHFQLLPTDGSRRIIQPSTGPARVWRIDKIADQCGS
jgi:hypothetical protein